MVDGRHQGLGVGVRRVRLGADGSLPLPAAFHPPPARLWLMAVAPPPDRPIVLLTPDALDLVAAKIGNLERGSRMRRTAEAAFYGESQKIPANESGFTRIPRALLSGIAVVPPAQVVLRPYRHVLQIWSVVMWDGFVSRERGVASPLTP
ncbi:hypothetical protein [Maritimibacter sp. UBA3975]|uniref:hypothetical protein n=1 Tax=Maritimibacter sp. UBA3975 TaxID=1946833 RepID=UPI000C08FAD1|nr:hypothetical protein [Maritimibacter sp. UBA3975]MAM63641.1 hypothetical protein [Maritimibacter sp.]|tara:strand:- start:5869 stop:6315 length:447 start_codon:yes stop_codon:yes gene_type:complete